MATEREILELIYQVQGEAELKALNALAEKHKETLGFLVAQNKHLTAAELAQSAAVKHQAEALAKTEAQARALEQTLARTGTASGKSANNMLMFANTLDDAQYGIRGVGNNLIQLAGQFGMVGSTIAVATAAGIALYNNWDNLTEVLGVGRVKTEAEDMEALGKATSLTADEQARLNKFKREQNEIEQLRQAQPAAVRTAAEIVKGVVAESGRGGFAGLDVITKGLVESRNRGGIEGRLTPDQRDEIAKLERERDRKIAAERKAGDIDPARSQARIEEFEARFESRRKAILDKARADEVARAEKDVVAAETDPQRLKGLINEVMAAPGAFPKNLAGQLREATPEMQEELLEADRAAEEVDEGNRRAKEARERREKADKGAEKRRKEREQETEELNKQGLANELAGVEAKKKSDEDALKGREKDKTEAEKLREQFVEKQADLFRKGFEGTLGMAMVAGRGDPELRKRVAFDLRAGGQLPEGDIAEVAANIVAAERQKFPGGGRAGDRSTLDPFAGAGVVDPRRRGAGPAWHGLAPAQTQGRGIRVRPDLPKAPAEGTSPFDLGGGDKVGTLANPLQNGQMALAGGQEHLASVLGNVLDRQMELQRRVSNAMRGLDAVGRTAMGRV